MPTPVKYKAPFCPGTSYHITFRSIDGLLLFHEQDDYMLFLRQYKKYFQPVFDTYAYNLLSNHTHFVVQVKERDALLRQIDTIPWNLKTGLMDKVLNEANNDQLIDRMIERQANSFMTSYVKFKNVDKGRKGGLFQSPFRRTLIRDEAHLQQAIIYVHANAQKHGIVKDFRHYPYSSYGEVLKGNSPIIAAQNVLDFFGGKEKFVELHESQAFHFYPSDSLQ